MYKTLRQGVEGQTTLCTSDHELLGVNPTHDFSNQVPWFEPINPVARTVSSKPKIVTRKTGWTGGKKLKNNERRYILFQVELHISRHPWTKSSKEEGSKVARKTRTSKTKKDDFFKNCITTIQNCKTVSAL